MVSPMSEIGTFRATVEGALLRRGFWLYVWRVTTADEGELLYVGRTGDASSPYASPPYVRMGQHLGSNKNQSALRRHLIDREIAPEACRTFDLIAHGPIHPEVEKPTGYRHGDEVARAGLMLKHIPLRDRVSAMEKRLATELCAVGYDVVNTVASNCEVPDEDWLPIRAAFAVDFPRLKDKD